MLPPLAILRPPSLKDPYWSHSPTAENAYPLIYGHEFFQTRTRGFSATGTEQPNRCPYFVLALSLTYSHIKQGTKKSMSKKPSRSKAMGCDTISGHFRSSPYYQLYTLRKVERKNDVASCFCFFSSFPFSGGSGRGSGVLIGPGIWGQHDSTTIPPPSAFLFSPLFCPFSLPKTLSFSFREQVLDA